MAKDSRKYSVDNTNNFNNFRNFGQFLNTLDVSLKQIIRKKENLINKLNRVKSAILFNETCLNEKLLPNYTLYMYIYIYMKVAHLDEHDVNDPCYLLGLIM